jgi:hypothetical protein
VAKKAVKRVKKLPKERHRRVFKGLARKWLPDFYSGLGSRMLIREYPPQCRTIMVQGLGKFSIALPYVQFYVVDLDDPWITWSKKSVRKFDDPVSAPLLPHVYLDGRMCIEATAVRLEDRMDKLVAKFWLSPFDLLEDEWPTLPYYDDDDGDLERFFKNWEKKTKKDPAFILKSRTFHPQRISLQEMQNACCDGW